MRIEETEITGLPTIHRVIIEDIVITDENDIAKCKQYEEENSHKNVKLIACLYAKNSLFFDCVLELVALPSLRVTQEDEDRYQCLVQFLDEHFRISYIQGKES